MKTPLPPKVRQTIVENFGAALAEAWSRQQTQNAEQKHERRDLVTSETAARKEADGSTITPAFTNCQGTAARPGEDTSSAATRKRESDAHSDSFPTLYPGA